MRPPGSPLPKMPPPGTTPWKPGAGSSRRDADVVMDQGAHVTETRVQRLTFR